MVWITPITDRASTAQYTHTDLNRVGTDIQYLADLLNSYGYAVTVSPKTTWVIGEKQRVTAMSNYLAYITALKTNFYGTTALPSSMNNLTAEQANNIEKLLLEIELYITRMIAGFRKSGTFKSGQGVILP